MNKTMINLRTYIILLLALCNISIRANLRGWTISLSSPVFQQTLYYNTTLSGGIPQFDGSLSAMTFSSINSSGTLENFSVTYVYDDFDRLQTVSTNGISATNNLFRESFIYDDNGNPLVIIRGSQLNSHIQYLSLGYDGNQIISLNESKPIEGLYPNIPSIAKGDYETGWSYDANGNRTADPSRGITSITYNSYNSPLKITFDDGSYIQHNYRSDGTNVGRTEREAEISTVNGGSNTAIRYTYRDIHRIGDFELISTVPKRVYIDNGYIDLNDNETYAYNYYVHDNQGSVRVVIGENGAIKQATDYSAYGVPSTRFTNIANNNHLHLGLEWQSMKGLYGYYNNARFRDALLAGTFFQQDPLAEKYYPFSPYHYGAGNPLKFTDGTGKWVTGSDGKAISFTINNEGRYEWSKNIKDDTKIVLNAMMKTNIGQKQVNKMLNTDYQIDIFISNIEGFENTGRTYTSIRDDSGNKTITHASIEINVHDINKYGDTDVELKDLTHEDRIGTVGVHESEHATNIQAISKARDDKSSREAEKMANNVTHQHLEELKTKHNTH